MSDVTKNVAVDIVAQETKAEKFIRIGEYRMNKALDAIGRLENLANRSAYEYTRRQCFRYWSSVWRILRQNLRRRNRKKAFRSLSGQRQDRRAQDEHGGFRHG